MAPVVRRAPRRLRVLTGMAGESRTALAVWGDPIDHSRSPDLHAAAYRVLGLDWRYSRRRVDAAGFAEALAGLDGRWRGLSLTMPLKEEAFRAAVVRDRFAESTGAVNTLLLTAEGPRGWNTDVGGIIRALAEAGVTQVETARIIGAGSTATSALVACAALGTHRVEVCARRPEAVAALAPLAEDLGVDLRARALEDASPGEAVPLTISTLPGGVSLPGPVAAGLAAMGGMLFDVVYGHWPTSLAEAWAAVPAPAISGEGMLLHQAVLQVRVFLTGDVDAPLPGEPAVVAGMRAALHGQG